MAQPFLGKHFTFTQPDGTTLEVKGWGNQYRARFETLDGRPLVRNPATGSYEPAETGPREATTRGQVQASFERATFEGKTRWQERLEEERRRIAGAGEAATRAPPRRKTVGQYVGLCLPVRFPDVGTTIKQTEISNFCNQQGYTGFGNNGSVRDYFLDNSIGRCDYSQIVAPFYTTKNKRAYYTDETVANTVRAQEIIAEALAFHKSKGFDFSKLSTDREGFVYAVNVFYAGPNVNTWPKGLWPHAHKLSTPVALASGMRARDYQITDIGNELQLGTYCHETGHMLCDFPDLYDYDDSEGPNASAGVGTFCLMCYGGDTDPRNPAQIGAYLKYRAGWAGSVKALKTGTSARASAAGNHFFIHRRNAAEYYILENRDLTGRDVTLPDAGLAIWHVDELGDNTYQQDDPTEHYECALIQADGQKHLEKNENYGDANDLFSDGALFQGATWWDRSHLGLTVAATGAPGPTLQFEVTATAGV